MTDTAEQVDLWQSVTMQPGDLAEVRAVHGVTGKSITLLYCAADELAFHVGEMLERNRDGWNIYASINPRKARARGDKNVALARRLFADRDLGENSPKFKVSMATLMPPPTLLIDSGHGEHAYWRLMAPLAPDAWREWQKDLAAMLGTDSKVCNPERLVRLPGFDNVKREPVPCRIIECDPSRVYDLADLPIGMRDGSDTVPPVFTVLRRRNISDGYNCTHLARCHAYLSKLPNAVSGAGGHDATYAAAATCNRFGLTQAEALELMAWFNSTKCDPPWKPREIEHKVNDAYRHNTDEHGVKLVENYHQLFRRLNESGQRESNCRRLNRAPAHGSSRREIYSPANNFEISRRREVVAPAQHFTVVRKRGAA